MFRLCHSRVPHKRGLNDAAGGRQWRLLLCVAHEEHLRLHDQAAQRLLQRPVVDGNVTITLFVVAAARLAVIAHRAVGSEATAAVGREGGLGAVCHVLEPPVLALAHPVQ